MLMWINRHSSLLERYPPDLAHCDEGILCRGQEGGVERGLATVKPSDAATTQRPPSLRVARPRTPAALRFSTDARHRSSKRAFRIVSCSGNAVEPNQVDSALAMAHLINAT